MRRFRCSFYLHKKNLARESQKQWEQPQLLEGSKKGDLQRFEFDDLDRYFAFEREKEVIAKQLNQYRVQMTLRERSTVLTDDINLCENTKSA